ncbi:hypothetical protein ACLN6N_17415 (plasmid) [Sphingomonas carotinifaciens]|uniref:hypothetical protein n=1 Tax=Sphingomonas carotinifaciens TaxID=1166323 RepID=UPI0039A0AD45
MKSFDLILALVACYALTSACSEPASKIDALAVMRNAEAFYGKRIEVCGDLEQGEHHGFMDGKTYPGYFLFSSGGEGSLMHGRIGLFVPDEPWLKQYDGKPACITGSISHYSGKTPQQLSKLPGREVTDAAVDAQWHFDATDIRAGQSD